MTGLARSLVDGTGSGGAIGGGRGGCRQVWRLTRIDRHRPGPSELLDICVAADAERSQSGSGKKRQAKLDGERAAAAALRGVGDGVPVEG